MKNVPSNGERFMDERNTLSLLEIAIRPKSLPICRVKSVTHAVGSSVAGLVAQTISGNIGYLMNQVDVCDGEIKYETEFSLGKLVEHMEIANGLHSLLCFTTVTRDHIPGDSQNIVAKAFEKLPKRSVRTYYQDINQVRSVLEREVIDQMSMLVERICNDPEGDWGREIRLLLRQNIRQALFSMTCGLGKIKKNVEDIADKAKGDFDADVKQVWVRRECRPNNGA